MPIAKGKSPVFFLISGVLLATGAAIYWWSEKLDGIENHDKAVLLGRIAGVIFVLGVISLVYSFIVGNAKKR